MSWLYKTIVGAEKFFGGSALAECAWAVFMIFSLCVFDEDKSEIRYPSTFFSTTQFASAEDSSSYHVPFCESREKDRCVAGEVVTCDIPLWGGEERHSKDVSSVFSWQ